MMHCPHIIGTKRGENPDQDPDQQHAYDHPAPSSFKEPLDANSESHLRSIKSALVLKPS